MSTWVLVILLASGRTLPVNLPESHDSAAGCAEVAQHLLAESIATVAGAVYPVSGFMCARRS